MLDLSRTTTSGNLVSKKVMIKETTVHEKLIHEHDFALLQSDKKISYYRIQCVTCDEYFCQLCGKIDCSCFIQM